jgi:hypothetical protein
MKKQSWQIFLDFCILYKIQVCMGQPMCVMLMWCVITRGSVLNLYEFLHMKENLVDFVV